MGKCIDAKFHALWGCARQAGWRKLSFLDEKLLSPALHRCHRWEGAEAADYVPPTVQIPPGGATTREELLWCNAQCLPRFVVQLRYCTYRIRGDDVQYDFYVY